MQRLLEAVEFRNPSRAREDIARLGGGIPERIRARIQSLLASVPDPDEALHFLERLRQDCPAAFNRIASSPAALRCLITTFSYSRFLSEAIRAARSAATWRLLRLADSTPHSDASAINFSGLEMAYPEEEPASAAPRKTSTTSRAWSLCAAAPHATARARLRATIRCASAPHAPTCARSPNGSIRHGPM